MHHRLGASPLAVVLAAITVVGAALVIGGIWGAEAFIVACLVGSIVTGLIITNGQ